MVLIFDLDDTLYDELSFVLSGFRAVAAWGQSTYGWHADDSYATMRKLLRQHGRGRIFDSWLAGRGSVRQAVSVYRHHTPRIALWPKADSTLAAVRHLPCYIVSDGHKVVQANKVAALKLRARVKGVYLTNQYGTARAKPSPYCFDLIRNREGCEWSDMMYVGDNPAKDFVGLNPLGVRTVRVLTGQHRAVAAAAGYDAGHRIRSLASLPQLIKALS
jgi:putative hydrolase of the HAD superfamily